MRLHGFVYAELSPREQHIWDTAFAVDVARRVRETPSQALSVLGGMASTVADDAVRALREAGDRDQTILEDRP